MDELKEQELIDLIYETILDPSAWHEVACQLTTGRDYLNSIIAIESNNLDEPQISRIQHGLPKEFGELYNASFREHDVWRKSLYNAPSGVFWQDESQVSRKVYEKSLLRNEFHQDFDVCFAAGCKVGVFNNDNFVISFLRARTQGEFDQNELLWLNQFIPHFRRAVALAYRNNCVSRATSMLESALGNTHISVLIDQQCNVLESRNELMLVEADLIKLVAGRLVFSDISLQAKMVAYLCSHDQNQLLSSHELCFSIGKPFTEVSYDVSVRPILIPHDIFGAFKKIGFSISFTPKFLLNEKTLNKVKYDLNLTKTEILTCCLLAQNNNAKDIANLRSKSEHTIRTQIKNIQYKLQASSKEQVVSTFIECMTKYHQHSI